jgi:RNA polymerase sigma factor (sigma-70 family)
MRGEKGYAECVLIKRRCRATAMTDRRTLDRQIASLMQAAQAGDNAAYGQLLKELTPRIRQIVRHRRRFLRVEDPEDLVQDILLSVHTVRATYDPRRPFMPWLVAIIRNRLADVARRDARRVAHEVTVDDLAVTFADTHANPSSQGVGDPDALKQAIQTLPPGQRDAIEMLKLRGLSLKEAAAESGTSVGALKVATHRAMATLRRVLGREAERHEH